MYIEPHTHTTWSNTHKDTCTYTHIKRICTHIYTQSNRHIHTYRYRHIHTHTYSNTLTYRHIHPQTYSGLEKISKEKNQGPENTRLNILNERLTFEQSKRWQLL